MIVTILPLRRRLSLPRDLELTPRPLEQVAARLVKHPWIKKPLPKRLQRRRTLLVMMILHHLRRSKNLPQKNRRRTAVVMTLLLNPPLKVRKLRRRKAAVMMIPLLMKPLKVRKPPQKKTAPATMTQALTKKPNLMPK